MRKQRIISLHRKHGPERKQKAFIVFPADRRGTIRDMDNIEVILRRSDVIKKYGPLEPTGPGIPLVGLKHCATFVSTWGIHHKGDCKMFAPAGTVPKVSGLGAWGVRE